MLPNINVFGREFSYYLICALVGIFAVMFYTQATAKRRGENEIHMLYVMLWAFLGVFVGGHVLYAIVNYQNVVVLFQNFGNIDSFGTFINYLTPVFGGAVFYGGLIGAVFALWIYLKKKKLSYATYMDMAAPAIPLFHFFGRIGCFLSGCCYGMESDLGFVYAHSPIKEANGVSRFPIKLKEAACNLGIFLLLHFLLKKGKLKGRLLPLYLLIYAPVRFVLEFFRGDAHRGFIGALSTSQFISILIVAAVLGYLCYAGTKKKRALPEI